jgi:hypothetical protein
MRCLIGAGSLMPEMIAEREQQREDPKEVLNEVAA